MMGFSYAYPVSIPFMWISTFFHETSHGLVAIWTGGEVAKLILELDGEGMVHMSGGTPALVGWAGYGGEMLFGFLIFLAGTRFSLRANALVMVFFFLMIASTAMMWAASHETMFVLLLISVIILVPIWLSSLYPKRRAIGTFLKIVGIYSVIQVTSHPLWLFINRSEGWDGAFLAQTTGVPAVVWLISWLLLCYLLLIVMWHLSVHGQRRPAKAKQPVFSAPNKPAVHLGRKQNMPGRS